MINEPVSIVRDNFQDAWLSVATRLIGSSWDLRNLIVHIRNPDLLDPIFHGNIKSFAKTHGLIGPKHVAYTIFPHGLYQHKGSGAALYTAYNEPHGLYEKLQRLKPG